MTRIKEFKDLELFYDSASAMTVTLSTDMPGAAMAVRKTLTFPASTGRKQLTLPTDGAEGNIYQVKVTSTGAVKLFGGNIRVRAIGEYFDGAQGEFWECPPQQV